MSGAQIGAQIYAHNAAAMWASLEPWSRVVPGTPPRLLAIEIAAQRATRVILLAASAAGPGQIGALLASAAGRGRVVVEDSFGELTLPAGDGVTVQRMPVMVRAAGGSGPAADGGTGPPAAGRATGLAAGPGIRVVQAADRATLAEAERVIVDGFPQRALQPYRPGRSLPPLVLSVPGWRVWLARRDGEPAAACCTYDDGAALGIYWLATSPQHRSRGLGRAIMSAALTSCGGRPAALVATAAGVPLYASLGFQAVSEAAWYRKPGPGG
jgi:GNAT superfamily N-acetyltransferase